MTELYDWCDICGEDYDPDELSLMEDGGLASAWCGDCQEIFL